MISIQSSYAFGSRLYYIVCDCSKKWIKSNVEQFVWEDRRSAERVLEKHLQSKH